MPTPKKKVVVKKSVKTVVKAAPQKVAVSARKTVSPKPSIKKAKTEAVAKVPVKASTQKPVLRAKAPIAKKKTSSGVRVSQSITSLARVLIDKILAQKEVTLPTGARGKQVVTRKVAVSKVLAVPARPVAKKPMAAKPKARK